jgi:hypothetical protein
MGKTEFSTFPIVAQLLGLKAKRVGHNEYKYPCPNCNGKRSFEANDVFGHCFSCDISLNYQSYYAKRRNISLKEAKKEILSATGHQVVINEKEEVEIPMANITVRNQVYSKLLSSLFLSKAHMVNLTSRGLSTERVTELGYKSFPTTRQKRDQITKEIIHSGTSVKGIPGFYVEKDGTPTFVYRKRGIMVPYRDYNNLIQGFQIRKDDSVLTVDADGEKEKKYDWITSKGRDGGCATKAYVHFACDFYYDFASGVEKPFLADTILLTEGAMKADIIHYLSGKPVLAVAGVNSLLDLPKVFKQIKGSVTKIIDCYDMDYLTNEHVQKARKKLQKMIEEEGFEYEILTWDEKYKGYDDFLLAKSKE